MSLSVLKLTAGDPRGKGKLSDYAFEEITVEGATELALRQEAACWSLVRDCTETRDHDDYGKDSWSTFYGETPFLEAEGKLVVREGELLAYRHGDAIFFLPCGNTVGNFRRILWEEWVLGSSLCIQ